MALSGLALVFCLFHQCWIQWVQHRLSRSNRLFTHPSPQLNSTQLSDDESIDFGVYWVCQQPARL